METSKLLNKVSFICFNQEECQLEELQVRSPKSIHALTVLEEDQIHEHEDLGEYFITCLN